MASDVRDLIKTLKQLDAEATPGPWTTKPEDDGSSRCAGINGPEAMDEEEEMRRTAIVITDSGYYPPRMPDANLITTLRNSLPRIVALLEAGWDCSHQLHWWLNIHGSIAPLQEVKEAERCLDAWRKAAGE